MAIYRGVGGSGESTTNTIVNLVAQYTFDAEAAKIAAQAAQAASEAAKVIAEDASASALADSLIAGTAADEASESAAEAAASAEAAATFDPDNFATAAQGENADTAFGWGNHVDAGYAVASNVYTKTEADSLLDDKADQATTYTKTEADSLLDAKQATLVSGTNIKTVNGGSLLGSGNLTIEGVPSGTVIHVAMNTAPSGYLKANGAVVSRTTYAALFASIGTTFGVGDGSTTFALPDLRGEFIRGWDDGRGVDSGRAFGSAQSDDFESHDHNIRVQTNGAASPFYYNSVAGSSAGDSRTFADAFAGYSPTTKAVQTTGGTETRPRNVALLACIKF
jgi:Microcystin-dependent protein